MTRSWPTGVVSAAAMIAVLTLVSRVLGFGRWVGQSATVGRGCVGEIYAAANQVPNVVYEVVVGGALAAAVVPVLAPLVAHAAADRGLLRQTYSALLTWALLLGVPLWLLVWGLAGPLAALLADDRCAGSATLTRDLLVVFAPQVPLYAVGVVLTGVLQAHHRFFWPAFAPVLSTVVVILSYLMVGATIGAHRDDASGLPTAAQAWLGWGTTAGVVALSVPLVLPVVRILGRPRLTVRFPPGQARLIRHQALGGLVALLAQQAYVVTVLWLATRDGSPVGTLPVFQYAQAVYLLPYAVLVLPLVTSAFPTLAAARGSARFARVSATTLRRVLLVSGLGTGALIGAAPAAEAFFSALEASGRGVPGMGVAVALLAAGLPGFALATQASRALQAMGRARTAAVGLGLGWLAAVVVAFLGVGLAGGAATLPVVCTAASLGMCLSAGLLLIQMRAAAGSVAASGLGPAVAWLVPALVGGGIGWWLASLGLGTAPGPFRAVLAGALGAVPGAVAAAIGLVRLEPAVLERFRGMVRH